MDVPAPGSSVQIAVADESAVSGSADPGDRNRAAGLTGGFNSATLGP